MSFAINYKDAPLDAKRRMVGDTILGCVRLSYVQHISEKLPEQLRVMLPPSTPRIREIDSRFYIWICFDCFFKKTRTDIVGVGWCWWQCALCCGKKKSLWFYFDVCNNIVNIILQMHGKESLAPVQAHLARLYLEFVAISIFPTLHVILLLLLLCLDMVEAR